MPRKPNPELLDANAPEATEAWFAQARPASEVLPGLFDPAVAKEMLKPKRGRPALATPKEHVNIRLDADIVGAFKETGAGLFLKGALYKEFSVKAGNDATPDPAAPWARPGAPWQRCPKPR